MTRPGACLSLPEPDRPDPASDDRRMAKRFARSYLPYAPFADLSALWRFDEQIAEQITRHVPLGKVRSNGAWLLCLP